MNRGIRNSLARAVRRLGLKTPGPQYAQIGTYRIRLPLDSRLLNYKSAFHLYDTALGHVADVLKGKYPTLHAIDIGANVGDTAALIRQSAEIPVLCVEGDPTLLPILVENVVRLGSGVEIEPCFVGLEGKTVNLKLAEGLGHNASLVRALGPEGLIKLRTLRSIIADHPAFGSAKLLKTDTEGLDFDIVRQSMEFIKQSKPILFFEYNPHLRPEAPLAGLEAIAALIDAGYSDFIYYDNFGNFLLHSDASNMAIFSDLDSYLTSNRKHGIAVWYFDICALHEEDGDLVPAIRSLTQSRSA